MIVVVKESTLMADYPVGGVILVLWTSTHANLRAIFVKSRFIAVMPISVIELLVSIASNSCEGSVDRLQVFGGGSCLVVSTAFVAAAIPVVRRLLSSQIQTLLRRMTSESLNPA